jgi:hypothetical protein
MLVEVFGPYADDHVTIAMRADKLAPSPPERDAMSRDLDTRPPAEIDGGAALNTFSLTREAR